MADEKVPKPSETPSIKANPPFSKDVIYPGAPAPPPSQAIAPGLPAGPPAPPPHAITAGSGTAAARAPASAKSKSEGPDVSRPHRSQIGLFFCWLAGVFLILTGGWGFVFLCCYVDRSLHLGIPLQVAGPAGGLGSACILFLLERNLWLSRFMGLRLGPHSTQLTETIFFAVFGIVGLLLRSTDHPSPAAARAAQEADGTREIVETVVFVVVLVLLLKTFLVEAFVIPTGSMADTLLGYHRNYECDKCRYNFLVNCSQEAEGLGGAAGQQQSTVIGGTCPNCGYVHIAR